jgi:hypothetical protein
VRAFATPEPIKKWSLTTLKEKLIKIGAKVVSDARCVAFQMAEVAIPRDLFAHILRMFAELRSLPDVVPVWRVTLSCVPSESSGEAFPDERKSYDAVTAQLPHGIRRPERAHSPSWPGESRVREDSQKLMVSCCIPMLDLLRCGRRIVGHLSSSGVRTGSFHHYTLHN